MKPWHKELGLTEKGAKFATDDALDAAARLLSMCARDAGVARGVLEEAIFRANELPQRSKAFQAKYLRENR